MELPLSMVSKLAFWYLYLDYYIVFVGPVAPFSGNVYRNYLADLRWLDTVLKKLSYSLLNTLNFRAVKFK